MGTDEARAQLEVIRATPAQRTLRDLLARMEPEIGRALPAAVGAERFTRLVLTEANRNPALFDCSPESVLGSMMLCAQLGLEPGPLGHAYLVPFKRQCTFVLGYKGMIELASRSGRLRSIVARTVYEGDEFDYAYGAATDRLRHVPCPPSERGKVRLYYCVARLAAPTGTVVTVLYPEDVETARKRSQLGRKNEGPWQTDYDAMARKTTVRRTSAYLPQSPQFARALEADEAVVEGIEGEVIREEETSPNEEKGS